LYCFYLFFVRVNFVILIEKFGDSNWEIWWSKVWLRGKLSWQKIFLPVVDLSKWALLLVDSGISWISRSMSWIWSLQKKLSNLKYFEILDIHVMSPIKNLMLKDFQKCLLESHKFSIISIFCQNNFSKYQSNTPLKFCVCNSYVL
jgi:hypothetical protein